MNCLLRVAAGTAVVAATFAFHGHASAHSNTVTCIDQATSTWRITNDYPLTESFTSPQGPSGNVAAGNGQFADVVYVGDSLQIDAVWSDGFTESRTGTGDCTPEIIVTTTTEAPTTTTELVTTTTEQETTTSEAITTTSIPTTTTSGPTTTTPTVTTAPTSTQPSTTTTPTTSSEPSTSSSVETTSTTSPEPTTSTTVPATSSTTPPAPSSTTPECSDNPNTPTDDCAPICQPVTQPDGTNSCGPSLPATGTDILWLLPAAIFMTLCGAVIVYSNRRGTVR